MVSSTNGSGHRPFTAVMLGSNPAEITTGPLYLRRAFLKSCCPPPAGCKTTHGVKKNEQFREL